MIIALTTPVRDKDNLERFAERNEIVLKRNEIAIKIAKENNIVINDLYSIVVNDISYYSSDGVHLNSDGNLVLAKQCAKVLVEVLK